MRDRPLPRKTIVTSSLAALAAGSVAFPAAAPALLAAGAALYSAQIYLNRRDRHCRQADGVFFLGNEKDTGKEIWQSSAECLQQSLVLGTTGAGKTEVLLGTVFNALATNSGAVFIDGKGDVALYAKAYAMAKWFGREDDLLVINFMSGNQDLRRQSKGFGSNTFNPFAHASSDTLTQMVVSLMDDAGGDGAMWKGRATAMFTGVMRALCWLRDAGQIDLNVGTIRDYLNLRAIIDLGDPRMYPEMPQSIRKSVRSYANSLPGFHEDKGYKQPQTTLDQHGYLEMQFTKILGSLADVYGHIFFTADGDVDMSDVVHNRRILIVMLPALEKAGDEIANLGKIVASSLKGVMGATLGSNIEGTWAEFVERRNMEAPSPFHAVLDEAPYYTVDGMSLTMAQARSTGIAFTFGAHNLDSMYRLNEREGAAIVANTGIKRFMRNDAAEGDDPETRKFRVNPADIRKLKAGEMILIRPDSVAAADTFYANPEGQLDRKRLSLGIGKFVPLGPSAVDHDTDQTEAAK